MDTVSIVILLVMAVVIAVLVLQFWQLKTRLSQAPDDSSQKLMLEWMKELRADSQAARQSMEQNIQETNKQINERLDNAGRVIAGLSGKLGEMSQIGPDIRRLAETLSSSKLRGNFGEEMLENMLGQVLPKGSYTMQYRFTNGETVDAAVMIGESILPIDSKFSLENFRLYKEAEDDELAIGYQKAFFKDTKKRVDEIHKKYILPQENTYDFALMYVPSQGVYEEIIINADLTDYTRAKRVIPVGPNTLFTYLQSIVLSLRGQQINKVAKEILKMISGIQQESDKFGKNLDTLGNHIKNTYNSMAGVSADFVKLRGNIATAASLQAVEQEAVKIQSRETDKLIE